MLVCLAVILNFICGATAAGLPRATGSTGPDLEGWTPKPTPPPSRQDVGFMRENELFARQETNTLCAYFYGNANEPLECFAGGACIFWLNNPYYFGCCSTDASGSYISSAEVCGPATTCLNFGDPNNQLDSSATHRYTISSTVLCPSARPYCDTAYVSDGSISYSYYSCAQQTGLTYQLNISPATTSGSLVTYQIGAPPTDATSAVVSTAASVASSDTSVTSDTAVAILTSTMIVSETTEVTQTTLSTQNNIDTSTTSGNSSPNLSDASATTSDGSSTTSPSPTVTVTASGPSVTTSSSTSSATTSPVPKPSHTGAIAGGVVGGVAAIALVAGIIWFLHRRKAREREEARIEVSQYDGGAR